MEWHVHLKGFGCVPAKLPTADGGEQDAMRIILVDQTGLTVHAFLGLEQFEQFKRFLADPEAETARQQAASRLVVPTPSMTVPQGKLRKH